jgi:surface antigen
MNTNLKMHVAILAAALAVAGCAVTSGEAMRSKLYFGQFNASMDETDRGNAVRAVQDNEARSWRNDKSGHEFTVTPTRTYTAEGRMCREYTISGKVSGQSDQMSGSACRQSDAGWVSAGG